MLGDNVLLQAPALKVASNGGRFIRVDGGFRHTCGLRDDLTMQCWGWTDDITPGTSVYPTATLKAPASIAVGGNIPMAVIDPQVLGYPASKAFTYAFGCQSNGHFSPWSPDNTFSCPTTIVGEKRVHAMVRDEDGAWSDYTVTVMVKEAPEATNDLKIEISTAALSPDLRKPLTAKLNAALEAIAAGQITEACNHLNAFINQVNAQRGKAIPTATADAWLAQANARRMSLGC